MTPLAWEQIAEKITIVIGAAFLDNFFAT